MAPAGKGFTQVAQGADHIVALHSSGMLYAEGYDAAEPPAGVSFVEISAGDGQTCGITSAGGVTCWGKGTTAEFKPPTRDVKVF